MVSVEAAAAAINVSSDSTGEDLGSVKKRAPMKTYQRRKPTSTSSARNAKEVFGSPPKQTGRRDSNHSVDSTDAHKSNDLLGTIAGATDSLQSAYDKLYKKYQNLKKRQLDDVQGLFDEQSERIKEFATAADDLVLSLRNTDSSWERQEEVINRSRLLEAAYNECRNDLAIERARVLELQQHLVNAEANVNKVSEDTGLCGSKLLNELLQSALQLTISNYGKCDVMFCHNESGYEFKLEQNKLSEEVGGKDALLYNVVSPGTVLHAAPEWMRSEIVFDKDQVPLFFRRILAVARGCSVSL